MEELEDEDAGEDTAAAEAEARKVFEEMVDTQARLGEEPRFTEAVKGTVNFGRGSGTDDTGLWGCVVLWQTRTRSCACSGTDLTPHTLPCVCIGAVAAIPGAAVERGGQQDAARGAERDRDGRVT